jgi:PPM family protein phosphatase
MAVPAPTWRSAAATDRGRRRARNEDALLVRPESRIYAVADGMGGHAAGDVASSVAIASLGDAFARAPSRSIHAPALARRLIRAFDSANAAILQHAAARPELAGMGTTLTALSPLVAAPQCVIAHIGDSRAYRLRDGVLTQLTRDHTWVQQQVDAGMITPLQARHHPVSSVLSRVLGTAAVGPPDTFFIDVAADDVFLLCSDGLTTMLDDLEVRAVLAESLPLDTLAGRLISAANAKGGHDNISVVLLQRAAR